MRDDRDKAGPCAIRIVTACICESPSTCTLGSISVCDGDDSRPSANPVRGFPVKSKPGNDLA